MADSRVLRRAEDFRRLREQGQTVRSEDVVMVYLFAEGSASRVAVVASRRVGGAVRRNRAKRLLREAHRRLREECAGGLDLMLIARASAARSTSRAIEAQLASLYKQAGLLKTRPQSKTEGNAPA